MRKVKGITKDTGVKEYTHCRACGALLVQRSGETFWNFSNRNYCNRVCRGAASRQPLETRFWSKVQKGMPDECWLWTGSRYKVPNFEYGQILVDGKAEKAHRIAYVLCVGAIPDDLWVLHKCDNPPCVNPNHLFLGTPLTNASDRKAKARNADRRGERNGRALVTAEQVNEMRRLFAQGVRMPELAQRYGLSYSGARLAVDGTHWRHV